MGGWSRELERCTTAALLLPESLTLNVEAERDIYSTHKKHNDIHVKKLNMKKSKKPLKQNTNMGK